MSRKVSARLMKLARPQGVLQHLSYGQRDHLIGECVGKRGVSHELSQGQCLTIGAKEDSILLASQRFGRGRHTLPLGDWRSQITCRDHPTDRISNTTTLVKLDALSFNLLPRVNVVISALTEQTKYAIVFVRTTVSHHTQARG